MGIWHNEHTVAANGQRFHGEKTPEPLHGLMRVHHYVDGVTGVEQDSAIQKLAAEARKHLAFPQ